MCLVFRKFHIMTTAWDQFYLAIRLRLKLSADVHEIYFVTTIQLKSTEIAPYAWKQGEPQQWCLPEANKTRGKSTSNHFYLTYCYYYICIAKTMGSKVTGVSVHLTRIQPLLNLFTQIQVPFKLHLFCCEENNVLCDAVFLGSDSALPEKSYEEVISQQWAATACMTAGCGCSSLASLQLIMMHFFFKKKSQRWQNWANVPCPRWNMTPPPVRSVLFLTRIFNISQHCL